MTDQWTITPLNVQWKLSKSDFPWDQFFFSLESNQIKSSNKKVLFKVGTFYNNQHKLSRAFQTDMHNKIT